MFSDNETGIISYIYSSGVFLSYLFFIQRVSKLYLGTFPQVTLRQSHGRS